MSAVVVPSAAPSKTGYPIACRYVKITQKVRIEPRPVSTVPTTIGRDVMSFTILRIRPIAEISELSVIVTYESVLGVQRKTTCMHTRSRYEVAFAAGKPL